MHDCPLCYQMCDCDGEDHENSAASEECIHDCERDLDDLGLPGYEDELEPRCRACGCTESHACPGGCVWATPDLCSRCV